MKMNKQLNWLFDYPNLQVYQYKEGFKFSLDSILLAEYAEIRKNEENIIDLCTGNAVIPIILNYKYKKKIIGVELQPEIFSLANDSVNKNNMQDNIELLNENVLNLENYFPGNNFDVVLSNPPYFKYHNDNYLNNNSIKSIARHEVTINLESLIKMASYLLKSKGRFYLVHVPNRIDEIIFLARKYNLGIKELQFVYSKINEAPIMVLVTMTKDGKFGTKVLAPVCIKDLETYQGLFRKRGKI